MVKFAKICTLHAMISHVYETRKTDMWFDNKPENYYHKPEFLLITVINYPKIAAV